MLFQTKVARDSCSLGLCCISTRSLKLLLENRVATHCLVIDNFVDAAHIERGLLELHQNTAESPGVQNAVLGEFFWVAAARILRQVANLTDAFDSANIRLPIAGQNLGEGSFTRAVSPNQPNLVSPGNTEVHLRHEYASTYAYLKVGYGNHVCSKMGGLFSAYQQMDYKSPSLQLSYQFKLEIKCRLPSSQSRP